MLVIIFMGIQPSTYLPEPHSPTEGGDSPLDPSHVSSRSFPKNTKHFLQKGPNSGVGPTRLRVLVRTSRMRWRGLLSGRTPTSPDAPPPSPNVDGYLPSSTSRSPTHSRRIFGATSSRSLVRHGTKEYGRETSYVRLRSESPVRMAERSVRYDTVDDIPAPPPGSFDVRVCS